jgi:hypothetical protein
LKSAFWFWEFGNWNCGEIVCGGELLKLEIWWVDELSLLLMGRVTAKNDARDVVPNLRILMLRCAAKQVCVVLWHCVRARESVKREKTRDECLGTVYLPRAASFTWCVFLCFSLWSLVSFRLCVCK